MDPTGLSRDAFIQALALIANPLLQRWLADNSATLRLQTAWEEDFQVWVLTRLSAIEEQGRRLDEQINGDPEKEARLAYLLSDHQFLRLHCNYAFEARREAMDERRRMLAYAAAGSFNIDLSLPQIARVERTVRELDPSEVMLLADMFDSANDAAEIHNEYRAHPAFDALVSAGCVRAWSPNAMDAGDYTYPTKHGRDVLAVMRGYVNAARPNEPVSGF